MERSISPSPLLGGYANGHAPRTQDIDVAIASFRFATCLFGEELSRFRDTLRER